MEFAIFIISHERSECITIDTLKRLNCTYPTYVIIDNLDKQKDEYLGKYGSFVKIFDKSKVANEVDTIMIPKVMGAAIYAREYCEQLAKEMNLDYFLVLDDDTKDFQIRYPLEGKLISQKIIDFNYILDSYIDLLKSTPIGCLGFGTNASYMGGLEGLYKNKRRCFNGFLRKTKIPFRWLSNYNEDSISCLINGQIGFLVLEIPYVQVMCIASGKGISKGGMWEVYNNVDEYRRKYLYVIANPSVYNLTISPNKIKVNRLWDNAIPKILEQKYKK